MFQTSGEYLSLINFNAKFKPLDIYVPPDSALWKNSYSLTCFATVVWEINSKAILLYFLFIKVANTKKKDLAKYFLVLSIDPDTSIIKIITALLSFLGFVLTL